MSTSKYFITANLVPNVIGPPKRCMFGFFFTFSKLSEHNQSYGRFSSSKKKRSFREKSVLLFTSGSILPIQYSSVFFT